MCSSDLEVDSVYLADKATAGSGAAVAQATARAKEGKLDKESQIAAGKALFGGTCSTCHQPNGEGIENVFPPLAKSDYLNADKKRAIGIPINGLTGSVTVNGKIYNSVMPPMSNLADDEIANILTYVFNSWGNSGAVVTQDEVAAIRKSTKAQRPAGAAE